MNGSSSGGEAAPPCDVRHGRRNAPPALRLALLIFAGAVLTLFVSGFARRMDAASLADMRRAELAAVAQQAEAASLLASRMRQKADAGRIAIFKEIEGEVEELRGLKFLRPVEYEILGREEIREVLRGMIRQHYTPEFIARYSRMLSAIGLLPSGVDIEEAYLALLGEQMAAFYDPFRGKLVMFREADPRSFQTRVILVHELVHALQDQHFHLKNFPLTIRDNDDRVLAATALIEGDATLVMNWFSSRNLDARNFAEMIGAALIQPTRELARAPRYLREGLLFPYLGGEKFAEYLYEEGGFELLAEAYARLPRSSTEILNPDLYGLVEIREEWPVPVPDGLGEPMQNTFGEFGIRIWFDLWTGPGSGRIAADGWRGDRAFAYLEESGGAHYAWLTQWEREADAIEFFDLALKALRNRYEPAAFDFLAGSGSAAFDSPRAVWLFRRGKEVTLIDAGSPAVRDRIAGALGLVGGRVGE